MTTARQGMLYKESDVPQKCVECGKETKRLVNAAEFEAEPKWTPLCGTECEIKFDEKNPGDASACDYI
jgi:hypothetical protein